ncbi:MAG: PxKF domain-containing protein [Actinomycetota bacterium]
MQALAVLPLAAPALAGPTVITTPGASFTSMPQEGATSLRLSYTLANSAGNIYPWEQRTFYMDGFCVDPYGEPARVYSAGAGAHSSGKSDTLDLSCPAGTYAQRFTIWGEAAGTLLEWKTGVAPLPPPPPPPGVTVQVDGAKFTKVPVAGSPRFQVGYELKSTPNEYMLGDSEGYPWEMDSFIIDALCMNSAGQYKSVYQGLAGRHPGGKKDELDIACPTGMTAGRFAVTMHEGPHRGKLMLEWVVPVTDPIGELRLDPAKTTAHAGTIHRVTVAVLDEGGSPVPGAHVNLAVTSGPNAGVDGTCEGAYLPFVPSACQTNGNGQIAYRYRGASVGTDQIKAFADMDGDGAMDASEPRATAEVKWVEPLHYVGMGDSYSAGQGLPGYLEGSDTGANQCHRSIHAYPMLVAGPHYPAPIKEMASHPAHAVMWDFIACSGAVTSNVIPGGSGQYDELPQLDQGRVGPQTDLVTMTIGGNDVGFARVLDACAMHACLAPGYKPLDDETLARWLPKKIAAVRPLLIDTYLEVQAEAPEASVVVLGYPHLFPASVEEQTCLKLGPWNGEQAFLRGQSLDFNDTLRAATATGGVHFVDVMDDWAGHEVCGNRGEWINGATLKPALKVPLPFKATDQSFHPNEMGEGAYAAQVDDFLRAATTAPDATLLPSGLPRNPEPVSDAIAPLARRRADVTKRALREAAVNPEALGSFGDVEITAADPSTSTCRTEDTFARRQQVRVAGEGFVGGSDAVIELVPEVDAESRQLAVAKAGTDGRIDQIVRIPGQTPVTGMAAIEVKGLDGDGGDRLLIDLFSVDGSNFLCDETPPVITVEAPVDGGSYLLGQDVAPSFVCNDASSGVETCTADSGVLHTSTPGGHTFTVRATDVAGNAATATIHYSVHYNFDGFFAPVDRLPVVNKATAGQTIPFKWRITNAVGVGVGDPASFESMRVVRTACEDSALVDVIEVDPATTGLRYLGHGYWQMNWKSPSALAGSCATVRVDLADGVTSGRGAAFSFR